MLFPLPKHQHQIAVIITCHNYEVYLEEAIHSALTQTNKPSEIIVIDDASDNDACRHIANKFPSVIYLRVNHKHPLLARQAGFDATTAPYVCFLDADDKIPPQYLSQAITNIHKTKTHIAYSDLQNFGDNNDLIFYSEKLTPKRLQQTNFLHVGCVTSRNAISISNAFDIPKLPTCHEDWMFWRKITNLGFTFCKQPIPYHARQHARNRSKKLHNISYYEQRGNSTAHITLAPIYRTQEPDYHPQWALEQTHFNAIFPNTIGDINPAEYASLSLSIIPHTDKYILHAINTIARTTRTDYVLIYNPHIQLPNNICDQLIRTFHHDIAAVQYGNTSFDCTMLVGEILRSYAWDSLNPTYLDKNTEKWKNITSQQ